MWVFARSILHFVLRLGTPERAETHRTTQDPCLSFLPQSPRGAGGGQSTSNAHRRHILHTPIRHHCSVDPGIHPTRNLCWPRLPTSLPGGLPFLSVPLFSPKPRTTLTARVSPVETSQLGNGVSGWALGSLGQPQFVGWRKVSFSPLGRSGS